MDKLLVMMSVFSIKNAYDELTIDDIKYMLDENVTNCEFTLYIEIIKMISEGLSYDEIFDYIDKFDSIEYQELLEDQKGYVKSKIRKDLNKRINMQKLKGEDKYE